MKIFFSKSTRSKNAASEDVARHLIKKNTVLLLQKQDSKKMRRFLRVRKMKKYFTGKK